MNTIVFDFDGTLADTRNLIVSTMQQTIAQLGLPAKTELECIKMIGLPLRQSFAQLLSVDDEQAALCENLYKNLFVKNYKPGIVVLFPDVEDTLAEMRAMGCVLAVASSRGHDSLDTLLDMLNIRRFFSAQVYGIRTMTISENDEIDNAVQALLSDEKSFLLQCLVSPDEPAV